MNHVLAFAALALVLGGGALLVWLIVRATP